MVHQMATERTMKKIDIAMWIATYIINMMEHSKSKNAQWFPPE